MKNINILKSRTTTFFILGIGIGIAVSFFIYQLFLDQNVSSGKALRLGFKGFVNPLVACNIEDSQKSPKLKSFYQTLSKLATNAIKTGQAKRISLYFRDMDSGEWTGVNENDLFIQASLIKVPIMMVYLKISEFDQSILGAELYYDGEEDENQREYFKPPISLQPGYYSINELIKRMITLSGNNSYRLLFNHTDKFSLAKVYTDLDLVITTNKMKNIVSPKSYSNLWRALYNASYLNTEKSNQALELLSKVEFKEGLAAGLPSNITVAHKFGERTINKNGAVEFRQLHDCGIVYYPNRPYLLCVMTEGNDFEQMKNVIQDLSRAAYQYVDLQ